MQEYKFVATIISMLDIGVIRSIEVLLHIFRVTTFTGFMTYVMIFTNVWFHDLLSVSRRDSEALRTSTRRCRRRAMSTLGDFRAGISSATPAFSVLRP